MAFSYRANLCNMVASKMQPRNYCVSKDEQQIFCGVAGRIPFKLPIRWALCRGVSSKRKAIALNDMGMCHFGTNAIRNDRHGTRSNARRLNASPCQRPRGAGSLVGLKGEYHSSYPSGGRRAQVLVKKVRRSLQWYGNVPLRIQCNS